MILYLVSLLVAGLTALASMLVCQQLTRRHQGGRLGLDAIKAKQAELIRQAVTVGDFVGGTHEALKPWWSELEREAFGYNDTERWIRETDLTLRRAGQPGKAEEWSNAWTEHGFQGDRSADLDDEVVELRSLGSTEPIRSHLISIHDPDTEEFLGEVSVCSKHGEATCGECFGTICANTITADRILANPPNYRILASPPLRLRSVP